MSRLSDTHKQQLKVREMQMEMHPDGEVGATPLGDDFDGKIEAAQKQLQDLQDAQERLERQKVELEEMNARKEEFLNGQVVISEKLSSTITVLERELFEMRQEIEDMEQTRQSFATHLDKIEKLNPETWGRENLRQDLNRAISMIDLAEDEYEQAMDHLGQNGRGGLFGSRSSKKSVRSTSPSGSAFGVMFMQGLAFNFPMVVLGGIGLVIWLVK